MSENLDNEVGTLRWDVVNRNAERLAAAEANMASLKESMAAIRTNQHETNNRLQASTATEQLCLVSLKALEIQMTKLILTVDGLVTDRHKLQGAWWAMAQSAVVVAAIGSAVWWAGTHMLFKS